MGVIYCRCSQGNSITSTRPRSFHMANNIIGVAIPAPDPQAALASIRRAEELGVKAAWMTSGGDVGDALTLFAAAAAQTETILLGTSIMRTWTR
ncbi:MAG: LLM class flavin-dependent oxidoreductase, partial [Chloroflexi bacterium]|nr:LLM class flavin-dependent oxidoreductase [Chloroflexota bacterium]